MEDVRLDVVEQHAEMISFAFLQLPSAEMGHTHTHTHTQTHYYTESEDVADIEAMQLSKTTDGGSLGKLTVPLQRPIKQSE